MPLQSYVVLAAPYSPSVDFSIAVLPRFSALL